MLSGEMQAVLSNGLAYYNYGNTKPAPENQGYPWLKSDEMRWYYYSGGWKSPNPEQPAPNIVRRFVTGDPATFVNDIALYDGGDTGVPSVDSGPMWEIDPLMEGRMAIGAGAIPGRTIVPVSLAVGDTIGAGEQTQTGAQVGPHVHPLPDGVLTFGLSSGQKGDSAANSFNYTDPPTTESNLVSPAVTAPMDTMPPALAGQWIKRTGRVNFVVP